MTDHPVHDLISLCRVLNDHGVKYAIAGAHACALHGHVRATEDYDVLVDAEPDNIRLVLDSLIDVFPDLPERPTADDIVDNVVLKIIDTIELDISIRAWSVDYMEASKDVQIAVLDGVRIPYLGLDSLLKSKSTAREIDQWDVRVLRDIQARKKGG